MVFYIQYMRVYLPEIPQKINFSNFKKFHKQTVKKKIIYSNHGIYCLENNIFYKIHFYDDKFKYFNILDYKLICDYSRERYTKTHIRPFEYCEKDISIDKYKLRENSTIELCIKKENNKIIDVYFLSKENDEINYSFQEDIIQFLNTF